MLSVRKQNTARDNLGVGHYVISSLIHDFYVFLVRRYLQSSTQDVYNSNIVSHNPQPFLVYFQIIFWIGSMSALKPHSISFRSSNHVFSMSLCTQCSYSFEYCPALVISNLVIRRPVLSNSSLFP